MHRAHDAKFGDPLMGDFHVHQLVGNHTGYLASSLEHGVGQNTHESDTPRAVHHADTARTQGMAQGSRRLLIFRPHSFR